MARRDENVHSRWSAIAPPAMWWRLVIAGAAALVLGLGLLRAVQVFARPLGLLILGVTLAAALAPPVRWLDRWLPRALAVILVYLALVLLFVAIGWLILPSLAAQAQTFQETLPQQIVQTQQWLNERLPVSLSQVVEPLIARLDATGGQLLSLPITVVTSVVDAVFELISVVFISIYALMAAPQILDFLLSLFPKRRRPRIAGFFGDLVMAVGGYVRGVALSSVIIGMITYLGLMVIGVEYAAVLAVLAGFLEIIPIFGPIIATVIVVGVALLQSLNLALYALIFMVILQQVEGNIVTPNVMSKQTEVNQLAVLIAITAGGLVGGLFGLLVAVPLAAALNVLSQEVVAPMIRRWTGAAPQQPIPATVHATTNAANRPAETDRPTDELSTDQEEHV